MCFLLRKRPHWQIAFTLLNWFWFLAFHEAPISGPGSNCASSFVGAKVQQYLWCLIPLTHIVFTCSDEYFEHVLLPRVLLLWAFWVYEANTLGCVQLIFISDTRWVSARNQLLLPSNPGVVVWAHSHCSQSWFLLLSSLRFACCCIIVQIERYRA